MMEEKDEMTDGEMWAEYRGNNQRKRWENYEKSKRLLTSHGILFTEQRNMAHLKIGSWNFWPSTGKFYNEKTKEKGRGVFNLLKKL